MNKVFEMPYGKTAAVLDWELMEAGLPPAGGWEEWYKHQKVMPDEYSKELDKALGIVRDEGRVIK